MEPLPTWEPIPNRTLPPKGLTQRVSFVLASLRALHLDRHLRPGALRTKRALTAGPHTGNARLDGRCWRVGGALRAACERSSRDTTRFRDVANDVEPAILDTDAAD
jgi:hypothetical protein